MTMEPPGTPAVGRAFLRAYRATGDERLMRMAQRVGGALTTVQLAVGCFMNRRMMIVALLAILLPVATTLLLARDALFQDARASLEGTFASEFWESTLGAVARTIRQSWTSTASRLDGILTRLGGERTIASEGSDPVATYERQMHGARLMWCLAAVVCLFTILRFHYHRLRGKPRKRKNLLHSEWAAHASTLGRTAPRHACLLTSVMYAVFGHRASLTRPAGRSIRRPTLFE